MTSIRVARAQQQCGSQMTFVKIYFMFYTWYVFLCSPFRGDAALSCSLCLPMTSSIVTGMREATGGCHKCKDFARGAEIVLTAKLWFRQNSYQSGLKHNKFGTLQTNLSL